MERTYILEKWNEYKKTLLDYPEVVQTEARDAFYAGVIAAVAILGETSPYYRRLVLNDMHAEAGEFLADLRKREEASRGKNPG